MAKQSFSYGFSAERQRREAMRREYFGLDELELSRDAEGERADALELECGLDFERPDTC